jgi:hypothetical protein
MAGGIPELLCSSPSRGVDLNQDFSRLRFRYGTCYRLKVQLSVNSIAFISGIALLLEFAVSTTRLNCGDVHLTHIRLDTHIR